MSKESIASSKQVQFGRASANSTSSSETESIDSEPEPVEDIENVNERLRHEMPHISHVVQTKHLTRVMATVCTIVVQQALQEIIILRQLNHMSKVEVHTGFVPMDEKYNMADFDLESLINTSNEFLSFKKLQRDIGWTETVLTAVIDNLKKNFYYEDVYKILEEHRLTKEQEKTVLSSKLFNDHELKKLRYYINTERRELAKLLQNVTQKLGNCKDQLNDSVAENKIKLAYTKQWQKSRHEQNKIRLTTKEKKLKEVIDRTKVETEKESRIHEELWSFLEYSVAELKGNIELWMERYDKDLEEKEQAVQLYKIKIENEKEKYARQLIEYETRKEAIDEYKAHKIQLENEAKELERRTNAVVKIQSWWRGVMFRKGLGPFRKKKGKGKGKGSGKKKSGSGKKK